MSLYTAVHVQSDQLDKIEPILVAWLQSAHRAESVAVRQEGDGFPTRLYRDHFVNSVEDFPTLLVIGHTQPGWITIHYNSFNDMKDVASGLSRTLACLVVAAIAESVSETYCLTIYEEGEHLRTLAWSGDQGEWLQDEGQPLPFEEHPLGVNLADEDEEPDYWFGAAEAETYCHHLGLQVWGDPYYESDWIVLGV